MSNTKNESPIERAFRILGGPSAVARAFTRPDGRPLTPWAVSKWRFRVPAERVLALEALTQGQVTRHELRPDLYPQEEREAA
jgi:DNA-binding transcriptional regulator YdaS (Cro superfamily)